MSVTATVPKTFGEWRTVVDGLRQRAVPPDQVDWVRAGETGDLFSGLATPWESVPTTRPLTPLPPAFLQTARWVAHHRDDDRWPLLYRLAWRLDHAASACLLGDPLDGDVRALHDREKSVRRDAHKMKAFVRFKETASGFYAWYQPDHRTLPLVVSFFRERFRPMHWHILTPDLSAEWTGNALHFGAGVARSPRFDDATDDLWRTYYSSTYNPTRTRLRAMKKEMPVRFWKTLPEAQEIAPALRAAPERARTMAAAQASSAAAFVPPVTSREALYRALPSCQGCTLYRSAKCAVPGEGPSNASIVFVGEQPGDEEDKQGRPFVGPAGSLLMEVLAEAGLRRDEVLLTNAVKHFRFRQEGLYRLHQKPRDGEIAACRPWLVAELALAKPKLIVCLGLSAAFSVLGRNQTLENVRRKVHRTPYAPATVVVRHPSSVLRAQNESQRAALRAELISDLCWALSVPT